MKRTAALAALTLLSSGCDRTAERENAQSDKAAVAQVQAAQDRHPPPVMLAPQPLSVEERGAALPAGNCSFLLDSVWTDAPVAVAGPEKAVVKFDGKSEILAADSGSAELAPGTRTRYTGRGLSLRLTRGPDSQKARPHEGARWPGSLTLFDRYERVVFFTPGTLECGA